MEQLRQSAKETGTKIEVKRDSELLPADYDSDIQEKHFVEIRDRLAENLETDTRVAKSRLKEKRIKLKKRVRRELGMEEKDGAEEADDVEEMSADMGSGSDDSNNSNEVKDYGNERDDDEDDEDDESIEEIPLMKRKRQKTSGDQTGTKLSSEAKALKLLTANTFF